MTQQTKMAQEAAQTPAVVRAQLAKNQAQYDALAQAIATYQPEFVYMIGRGTSDHAGVFGKYLIETELSLAVAAAAPSVNSVYGKSLNLKKALVIVISQSGRSPDIIAQAKMAKASGGLCVALVNDESSPLNEVVDIFIPLQAGPEFAVAATKSYLATLSALLSVVATCKGDNTLMEAIQALPDLLDDTIAHAPVLTDTFLQPIDRCVVLGRAFGYAISREIALKLKEVCGIQAEAFSSAEFLHGPISLLNRGVASLDVTIPDASAPYHQDQINEIKRRGGKVLSLLTPPPGVHPLISPLLIMQRFYLDIELAARNMNMDPDSPVGLKKVTETM